MDPEIFKNSPTGSLAITEHSQFAFVPDELPPRGIQNDAIINRLSDANIQLGELKGAGRNFPNPYLLIRPLQRREAVASSNIEGTHTTLSDLFLLEAGASEAKRPPDTREVMNYVSALEYGIKALVDLPISTRMITEMHRILLSGLPKTRGGSIVPGEYKRNQNFIGGTTLSTARFIPAPPQEMSRLMGNFENFINSDLALRMPALLLAAITHYQFETIHPFPDGNGRVGRLLVPIILKHRGALDEPLLYISPYIEERKDDYITGLYNVSKTGDWNGWIDFFLQIIEKTCRNTIRTIQKLHDLNIEYLGKVQKARRSALLGKLIDWCFEVPYITIRGVEKYLDISYLSARNHIKILEAAGILSEYPYSKKPKIFVAWEIYEILETM